MTYRIALERLRAYEGTRLIECAYQDSFGDCCALGVVLPASRRDDGSAIIHLLTESPVGDEYIAGVQRDFASSGMTLGEAEKLQKLNDFFEGTPEERKAFILEWLEARVAEESP